MANNTNSENKPLSIGQRRWRKFKTIRRGYYSLVLLSVMYGLSFLLPLIVNNKALMVSYNGQFYFPAFTELVTTIPFIGKSLGTRVLLGPELGQTGNQGEVIYRQLSDQYKQENQGNWVLMPLYPYSPLEDIQTPGNVQYAPPMTPKEGSTPRLLGTDDRGRDVFARMAYGFQISISFALLLIFIEYLIGVPIGAVMGYFGGLTDILIQRFIEIWGSLPTLFLIIIVVSMTQPSFGLLLILLSLTLWIAPTTLMRAEFYRERTRDYVVAAVSIGVPTWKILLKHILPNSLVPIITFLPFAVVGGITALVGLDFLGFGLPPPTPSWGEMLKSGTEDVEKWWLVMSPIGAMFLTLVMIVFIGEAVREAFDPKTFSRLR